MAGSMVVQKCALGLYGIVIAVAWLRRKLQQKPYPDIPYSEESARRIAGDVPNLVPTIEATNEFSNTLFTVTTKMLGVPITQLIFPGIRKPMIIIENPQEMDILKRRNKEFDKAALTLDIFAPIFPHATISQYTTPELRAQKRRM